MRRVAPYPALLALASAGLFAACLGCRQPAGIGPVFATSPELPTAPRLADGVAVDPATEFSASSDTAQTGDPVVVLRPPVPDKTVHAVLSAFFRAVATDDTEAMAQLLTSDAATTNRARGGTLALLDHWRARMRRLSYRAIAAVAVYDDAEIEIYRYDDLGTIRSDRPIRPPTMIRSDLLARVPIATARVGHERLFGDEILFLLRRDRGRLRIREAAEDFQLP
jgi:hypothetical protein